MKWRFFNCRHLQKRTWFSKDMLSLIKNDQPNWSVSSRSWNRVISHLFCKFSDQTKNWIISFHYLDDLHSAWKKKSLTFSQKYLKHLITICHKRLIIGAPLTFQVNHNVYIALIVSYNVFPSDWEKLLIFVFLKFHEQILC